MKLGNRERKSAFVAATFAAAASVVLAGCTPNPGVSPSAEATAGGTLVVGITADVGSLSPWTVTQFQALNVLQNVYGTLTEYDAELNTVPGLAESWDISEDGLTMTLQLREGVTFADGSEFDSDDVKYSLDAIMDEETAAVGRASLTSVTSVEASGPLTITLTLGAPDVALLSNLATINMAMVSSDDTQASISTSPNGTGPFEFQERVPNQSITLVRNDDYWGDDVALQAIEFRIIPDESSIVSAMQGGNVQFAVINDPIVAQTAETAGINVETTPQLNYHALMLNAERGDLTDVNVRLAIQCAIDRQEVLDTAALGEGEITGPITSPAFRSDPEARPCPERDLDKAAEYLDKAGKPDGVTFTAIVSQGQYATSVNEAQSIQSQLAEAGIVMELEVLESGSYDDRWIGADFDAAVALNGGRPDPDGAYGRYFTSTGNLNHVAAFRTPELDALFLKGKETVDLDQRKEVYAEISEYLEDNAPWIWLFTSYNYTASTTAVEGFTPMANGSLQFLRDVTVD